MFQETKWYDETTIELMAPTLLPELHLLKRVKSGSTFCWLCVAVNSVCQPHYLFQPFIHFYCVSGEDKGTKILGTVCRPQQRHRASKVWLDCIHLFINNSLNVSLFKPQVFSSHISINAFLIRRSNLIYWFACACVKWFKVHYLYIYFPQVHSVQRWSAVCEASCWPVALQRWPSRLEEPAGFHH